MSGPQWKQSWGWRWGRSTPPEVDPGGGGRQGGDKELQSAVGGEVRRGGSRSVLPKGQSLRGEVPEGASRRRWPKAPRGGTEGCPLKGEAPEEARCRGWLRAEGGPRHHEGGPRRVRRRGRHQRRLHAEGGRRRSTTSWLPKRCGAWERQCTQRAAWSRGRACARGAGALQATRSEGLPDARCSFG